MKNRTLRTAGFAIVLLLVSGGFYWVSAQPGRGQFRGEGRPMNASRIEKIKLTDDQQKQMTELKAKFQEETLNIKNLVREKMAHIKTLLDMENRDVKDLDKTIDELSALKGELMKKGIVHRDEVKKILTPEQMKIWEFKAKQRMKGMRMRGQGMQMMGQVREVEGNEVEVQGKPMNIERKVIIVDGKPVKVTKKDIKGEKSGKKKGSSKKSEKEDEKEDR